MRDKILDSLNDSSVEYLPDEAKEKIVDRIIDETPDSPVKYHLTRDDRNTLIAIASCDILAVIPVILPYLILGFGKVPLLLSRLIAAIAIGYIVFLYAEAYWQKKMAGCRHLRRINNSNNANNLLLGMVTRLLDGWIPSFFFSVTRYQD